MTRVVPTEGGSALVPASDQDQVSDQQLQEEDIYTYMSDVAAEIEAAKQASLRDWQQSLKPHLRRIDSILDTDSPTT
eukprot:3880916-Amphidinium_carterae.1